MCGIAGAVDLTQSRKVEEGNLRRMAASIHHRGPDENGYHLENGIGLASKRLSIVGLSNGRQPVTNEDGSIVAVFNGEFFNYVEVRQELISRGHQLKTDSDSEILVHLWEEKSEDLLEKLKGQFAFALWDKNRRVLFLARDRFGIIPLHWAINDNWFLFGSEIKSILASGLIQAKPDLKGLDNVFTFFCMPGRRTAFAGINALEPGHCLKIDLKSGDRQVADRKVVERRYWDFDFPDRWEHRPVRDESTAMEGLKSKLQDSIKIRMRADVPVAAYLSGGVDSSLINSLASEQSPGGYSTFTARVNKGPSEADLAKDFANQLNTNHFDINCDSTALASVFPEVVKAADAPVADPNAGSLFQLSKAVHDANFKVVLTGEGADEAFAGYFWYKLRFLLGILDSKFFKPYQWLARFCYRQMYKRAPRGEFDRINGVTGGYHAHVMVYHCTSVTRWRLLNEDSLKAVQEEPAYDQLRIDPSQLKRWHPLNQSLYFGYKTMLPGLLLNPRGDRPAMANSVEVRYPFLDEDLVAYCCGLNPSMKLKGLGKDKYLLRRMAKMRLPSKITRRKKKMFRAPFADTFLKNKPAYVQQLLSEESLVASNYFQVSEVNRLMDMLTNNRLNRAVRLFGEMAMCVVLGTQLWHHLYIDDSLCELSAWSPPGVEENSSTPISSQF